MGKNIREIARLCGVSTATVSRVLNNKPDVSEEARRRILETMKELNFSPKLTVNRTNILGVTIEYRHALSTPYVSSILEAVEDTAYEAGYDLLILRNERLRQIREHYGIFLKQQMLSGLIILLSQVGEAFLDEIALDDFPHVVMSNRPEANHWIDSDWYNGALEATRYLISLGHTNIAFIQPCVSQYYDHQERLRGHLDGLAEAGLLTNSDLIVEGGPSASPLEYGYEALNTLLNRNLDVTAVLTVNDFVGGVIECLRVHDLSIPDDLSVISFDDSLERASFYPSLTVVAQDASQLGRLAAKEVIQRIEFSPSSESARLTNEPVRLVLPTKLIIRQTTDVCKLVKGTI